MKTVKISRKEAIAAFCVECNGGDAGEIVDCLSDGTRSTKCFLYDLRPKSRPDKIRAKWFDRVGSRRPDLVPSVNCKSPLTEEQKEAAAERLAEARKKIGTRDNENQ